MRDIYCLNKWMPFNPLLAEPVEYLLEESSRSEIIDMSNSNAEYITTKDGIRLCTKLGKENLRDKNSNSYQSFNNYSTEGTYYDYSLFNYEFTYDKFSERYDKKGAFD